MVGLVVLLLMGGGSARAAGSPSAAASAAPPPCDIYVAAGTPCVAAYSTVRVLASTYTGPLYQVSRASDGATLAIFARPSDGVADASAQQRFCRNTRCSISELYDQSGKGNNLTAAPGAPTPDLTASAGALPVRVDGQLAYGVDLTAGVGYRDDVTHGVATDGKPESMYMVTSSHGTDSGCCFDFGNAETNNSNDGDGHMDAVSFSSRCVRVAPCYGSGPWVQADFENGLFQSQNGDSENPLNPSIEEPFVTAMLENDGQDYFALMDADAQAGGLTVSYAGMLPDVPGGEYSPMRQEGGIVLGVGGDNSRDGTGEFFEGVMTAGMPNVPAESAVQADIVAAGYGGYRTRAVRWPASGRRGR